MIKANEANLNTKATIEKFAKEFVLNECESAIQSAIAKGWFHANVSLSTIANPEHVGPVIVKLLKKEYGYDATYFCSKNNFTDKGYIWIDWSNT